MVSGPAPATGSIFSDAAGNACPTFLILEASLRIFLKSVFQNIHVVRLLGRQQLLFLSLWCPLASPTIQCHKAGYLQPAQLTRNVAWGEHHHLLERVVSHHIAQMSETRDVRSHKTFICASEDFLKLKTRKVPDIFFLCSSTGSKVFYLDETSL